MIGLQSGSYDRAGAHLSSNVNLWPRPLVVFANARAFAELTDERAPHPARGRRGGRDAAADRR